MAEEPDPPKPWTSRRRRQPRALALPAGLAVVVAFAALVGLTAAVASTGLTLVVNSTSDAVDASVGNGVCAASSGSCTLRAAIQEANAVPGADVVHVPSGTYELAIRPQGQNDAASGDLDITGDLTIVGAGAGSTIVDAGAPPAGAPPEVRGADRLFEILVNGGTVALTGLTLSDGYAAEYGGAILNSSTATLTIVDSTVRGSAAGKTGGAIDNHVDGRVEVLRSMLSSNYAVEDGSALNNNLGGAVELRNSTVSGNSASAVGLDASLRGAGAVSNHAEHDELGTITVVDSLISENRAGGGRSGAGISNNGAGTIVVERTTFSKNHADGNGGAIFNGTGGVTVSESTFSENGATGGGGIASAGGFVSVLDSTFTKNIAEAWGGGILNGNLGSVTIRSGSFRENVGLNGGGFANEGSGLVIVEDSTFTKNSALETVAIAGGEGGGMHSNSGGEVVVTGGAFAENSAANGGGLSNEGGGTMTISGTRFSSNTADERGGGILVEGGAVRMVAIDVVGNLSKSTVEGGGGISYAGDKSAGIDESAAIEGSRIRDNKSEGEGGGIDSRGDGPLVVTTTAVTGNTALAGGAIHHVGDAPLHVTSSTLSGNIAQLGGGVFTDGDGEATLENTTVSGNLAGQFGGGLLASSSLTVRNSTVTRNSAPSGGGINNGGGDSVAEGLVFLANAVVAGNPAGGNCVGAISSRGGNVENTNTCQLTQLSDQPGTDPRLGPLADNGGPTQTHALLAGSAAQEKAVCTELDPCPSLDQRGVERPRFARFDAGSYESELTPGQGSAQHCAGRTERPVPADFDSWVSQSSPSTNFGNDSILRVRGGNERALVRFALPPLPPGCKLVGATLRLFASSATEGRTLEARRLASAWSELGATWSNQPATAGPVATTLSGLGFLEWDVLAQAAEMYTLGDNGFLIRDSVESGSGQQSFHGREKGTDRPPELVLVFDDPDNPPPPEECPRTPQVFSADRDSWVSQGSASNNFGTDSSLKVKSQGASNSRALVRFPLPTLPSGCTTVASAVLRLEASSAKEGRTLEALQALSWSETGVTWSNQPPVTGAAATASSASGVLEWQVTPQVLGIYTSANHGFVIRDGAENGPGDEQAFNSREKGGDASPKLVLAFDDSTPETTIDSGPVSPTDATSATFAFSSDRDDSAFECSLDGAPFQACVAPHAVSGLGEGGHALEVRATRKVRAVDPTPATYAWVVAIPPETSVAGPASPSASPSAAFTFAADDAEATFDCSLDGAHFSACTSPFDYDGLGDGEHEVRVRAVDPFGNVDPTPASHVWMVAVPPETAISDRPPDPTNSTAALFAFGGSDNDTVPAALSFECSLDGAAFESCATPREYVALAGTQHAFAVRATDLAGNTDPSPASYTWTVDTDPPETALESAPADPSNDTSPTFAFGSESGARFECRLDGGEWADCESPSDYNALADGAHEFEARATDTAGNTDASPASYSWRVDTAAPETTIDSRPAALSNTADALFDFSSEASASFECRLDDRDWDPCTSPQEYPALDDGAHSFDVRATDAAGNTDSSPASHAWTIDTVAPETAIDSTPADSSNDTSPSFTFSSEEDASFECRLDQGAWEICKSPQHYNALTNGAHEFQVRATDRAGNTDPSPASYTWMLDTVAPETAIASAPADPSNDTAPSFALSSEEGASFDCRLDGGEWADCESPQHYNALADGAHEFEARATDRAGNTDASPASHSWTIDTVAPESTIDSGPPALTNNADALFGFSSEEGASFECRLDGGDWDACTSPQEYAALADGVHSFDVRATDAAGNTDASPARRSWTIDTVAPDSTIDSGPPALTSNADALFGFSSEEGASFECRLDSGDWDACTSPQGYEFLRDGGHSLEVRASDTAGNTDASPASYFWTVDTLAPETAIDSAPADPSNDGSPSFAFSSEEGARFECRVDGSDFVPCISPQRYAALADGAHSFEVRASDVAGNVEASPASHGWSIDTVAPESTIDAGPPLLTNRADATFDFGSEPGAGLECRLDEGDWQGCESPQDYSALTDGTHEFEVRASDLAGNVEDSPASYHWTVDTVAPETTIDAGPAALTNNADALFVFSSEDGASFECRLDGGDFDPCFSPQRYAALADGAHSFEVRASDAAPNTDASPASHAWTVDTVAPETTIDSGPAALTNSAEATFTLSAEPGASFECRLDEGDWEGCESPQGYAGLTDGAHRFEVRAGDAAGNVDASPADFSWTVDTVAPETTIDSGPDATTPSTSAAFTFSASEAGSTFACSLDGGAFTVCTSPHEYSGLAPGTHRFRAQSRDSVGNLEPEAVGYEWTILASDTAAPDTAITVGPTDPTSSTSASFSFTGSDDETAPAALRFECRLDSQSPDAFVSCPSRRSYSNLAEGSHAFEVRAIDSHGNADPTPAAYTWTVDTTAPQTTIDSGPAALTNSTSATFSFAASEAGSSFQCSIDGAVFAACSSPRSYTGLGSGAHTFQVRASDPAGNTDATPASRSWTVDTAPPQTTIDSGPATLTNSTSATLTFSSSEAGSSFQCSLDGAVFAACTSPQQYAGLASGPHSFQVRASDPAGNTDATPASRSWSVDTAPPQTTIGSGPAGLTNSTSATFAFSSSEAGSSFQCSIDGAVFAACGSPRSYTGLGSGAHTFQVRATDPAGNTDPTPASHSWTVDVAAPQTTVDSGPPVTTQSTSATLTFSASEAGSSFQCSLNGSSFAACTSPTAYTGLSSGSHSFQVRATDPAGNTDSTPASYSWTVSPSGSCAASTITVGASADSWVLQSSSTSNYGNDSVLKVDTKAGANARGLVRFTLPPIPTGCQVTDARLRLYASSYKTGRTLEAVRLAAAWTEGGVTWNNQPSTAGTIVAVASAAGYREWIAPLQVQAMYAGGNHGFLIRDASEGGAGWEQGFNSREKGTDNPPRLVITFGN